MNLPEPILNESVRVSSVLKQNDIFNGKFIPPQNLHVTLKFLGNCTSTEIEEIKSRLLPVDVSSFNVSLTHFGVFGNRKARVVWIGIDGVIPLFDEVQSKLDDLFPQELPFVPHITLIRNKSGINKKEALANLADITIRHVEDSVSAFHLMESHLGNTHPVYKPLHTFPCREG